MKFRQVRRCAAAFAAVCVLLALAPGSSASGRDIGFPYGYYDLVYQPGPFSYMTSSGMNTTVPYGTGRGIGSYLSYAASSGMKVFVQLDPTLVRAGDVDGVTSIVNQYKTSSALRGWYLADEPTIGSSPISVETAKTMYTAIKAADPAHLVAIAFNSSENALPYHDALDVAMWDNYPGWAGSAEFANMPQWRSSFAAAASSWRRDRAFVPIVQTFGSTGTKYTQFRLPTAAEERYMVYSALQTGVDGMLFWSYYAADPTWRTNVFDPLASEIKGMLPAMRTTPVAGVKSSLGQVAISLYLDPATKRYVLVAVHNAGGTVRPTLSIPNTVPVRLHRWVATFKPWEVRTLRF